MIDLIYEPWFRLLMVIFIAVVLSRIVVKGIVGIFKHFASFTKTKKDDLLVEKFETPLMFLVGLIALRFGLSNLGFWLNKLHFNLKVIDSLNLIFIARIVSIFLYLLFEFWSGRLRSNKNIKIDEQIVNIIYRSLGFLIYVIACGYILSVWKIDIWPVLGSLGIAGLAFAFALQETLKNLFGGIQLILDKNFKKGEIIELSGGISGQIYDITLRSTRIKTWDNKLVIIPNSLMANDVITNISKPTRARRITVSFGVEYGSDPDYVKAIVIEEINSIEIVEKIDPAPSAVFTEMGPSALHFEAKYWIKDLSNYISAKDEGTTKIYERLNREGIGIPFPQVTIWNNDMGKTKSKPYKKKVFKKK